MKARREHHVAPIRSALSRWLSKAQWIACVAFSSAVAPLSFADVSYVPLSSRFLPRITVFEQITRDDLRRFVDFTRMAREDLEKFHHGNGKYLVFLDSKGGDVETAISIGKIARSDKAGVTVGSGKQCISACVFILAGGVTRTVLGQVGIHRPFSPNDTRMTANLQKDNYERLATTIKSYLHSVNIPIELYDLMIRVPPQKTRFLSPDELQRYGLSEDDPYEDAANVAAAAKFYGITVEEYIRRQAKGNSECSAMADSEGIECYGRILKEGQ